MILFCKNYLIFYLLFWLYSSDQHNITLTFHSILSNIIMLFPLDFPPLYVSIVHIKEHSFIHFQLNEQLSEKERKLSNFRFLFPDSVLLFFTNQKRANFRPLKTSKTTIHNINNFPHRNQFSLMQNKNK